MSTGLLKHVSETELLISVGLLSFIKLQKCRNDVIIMSECVFYVIEGHPNTVIFNVLKSVKTMWWTLELLRSARH
jgi:hypothetical protein